MWSRLFRWVFLSFLGVLGSLQAFGGNWWDVFIRAPQDSWMETYFARVHPGLLGHIPVQESARFHVEIYYCYEAFSVLYEFEAMAWLGQVILRSLQEGTGDSEAWSEAAFIEAVAQQLPDEEDVRGQMYQVLTNYIEHIDVDAWQPRIGTVIERCPRGGVLLNEALQALRAIIGQNVVDSLGQLEQACARIRSQFEQAELTEDTVEALCWRMAQNEDRIQGRTHLLALWGSRDLSQAMEFLFRTIKLMLLRGVDHRDYPRIWNCAVGAMVQAIQVSSDHKKPKKRSKHGCCIQ